MRIDLIGCGCGAGTLTAEAARAIEEAELLLGSRRLLDEFAPAGKRCVCAVGPQALREALKSSGSERACVLFSGDSGFYSGAAALLPLLEGEDLRLLPGISSLQLLSAGMGRSWQDWRLFSAHGRDCDVVAAVCGEGPAFFLTGGEHTPSSLCARLCQAGLGELAATVGERLGTAQERLVQASVRELAQQRFDALSVLLVESAPQPIRRGPGLPDSLFRRCEGIPMTKQEIRCMVLSKLGVTPEEVCWDIGAGTGSVGIEMALMAKAVYGVERSSEALALAEENRRALGAWRLRLVHGEAPEALASLPRPDAVFIGGSGGRLPEILRAVSAANPKARFCISAIAVETLHAATAALEALGCDVELCQLSVSRSRSAGGLHLMLAQNPVWLILGTRP